MRRCYAKQMWRRTSSCTSIANVRIRRRWKIYRPAYQHGAILRHEIFFRGRLHALGRDSKKTIEDRVDAVGIAVEEREAREIVHQAEAWHVRAHAGFEHGVEIGAKLHLHRFELSGFDSLVLQFLDRSIEELQHKGVEPGELEPVKVKFRSDFYSMLETGMGSHMPRFGLMHYLACFTLFDGDPDRINTILDGFLAVTPEGVQAAAKKYLVPQNRAVLIRRPVNLPAPSNPHVGNGGAR